jgi:acetyl esterase/lipase
LNFLPPAERSLSFVIKAMTANRVTLFWATRREWPMARMARRLQLWGWIIRRQASVAGMTEAEVIALQSRPVPSNFVFDWLFGTVAPGIEVSDRSIPGPGGDIPIRVYRPAGAAAAARPLVLYFHGGGFVFGELRLGDWLCSQVAATVDTVVVAVAYRLAPTYRFPAAVDDCYAALTWAAANAAELGAGGPMGVMGESAGGNLSAAMCLLARDMGGPALAHQTLIYPATDMTEVAQSASAAANADAPFLSTAEIAAYRRLYLGPDGDENAASPSASPLLAADHGGLPPALIQVAEHDPHGFLNIPGLSRSAPQALAELCAEQSAAFTAFLATGARQEAAEPSG